MADHPNDERLTLTVDWPEITLERLSRVTNLWANLVQSVSAEATGKRTAIKWVVTKVTLASPLIVEATPAVASKKVNPAITHEISHAVVAGIAHLDKYSDMPEYFSGALGTVRKLAELANPDQARRLLVSNGTGAPAALTSRVVATVDDIIGPVTESYGSVEGLLEGVFTHGKRRIYVYDSLSGRQVRCYFDDRQVPLDRLLGAYEKRVIVSGLIKSKAKTGEPLSVQVVTFDSFRPDSELMPTDDVVKAWSGRQ